MVCSLNYGPSACTASARFNEPRQDNCVHAGWSLLAAFRTHARRRATILVLRQDIVDVDVNSDQNFDLAADMDNASLTRINFLVSLHPSRIRG